MAIKEGRRGKTPVHFTQENQDAAIGYLEKGYTRLYSSLLIGANEQLVTRWAVQGERGDEKYVAFYDRVVAAEKKSQAGLIDQIKVHADKDWRAAAWLLERRFDGFKLKSRTSQDAQNAIDAITIKKAEAELEYTEAKTKALNRGSMTPDQLLEVLERVRDAAKQEAKEELFEQAH